MTVYTGPMGSGDLKIIDPTKKKPTTTLGTRKKHSPHSRRKKGGIQSNVRPKLTRKEIKRSERAGERKKRQFARNDGYKPKDPRRNPDGTMPKSVTQTKPVPRKKAGGIFGSKKPKGKIRRAIRKIRRTIKKKHGKGRPSKAVKWTSADDGSMW